MVRCSVLTRVVQATQRRSGLGTACITIPDHKCGRKVRHVRRARARSLTRSLLSAGGGRGGGDTFLNTGFRDSVDFLGPDIITRTKGRNLSSEESRMKMKIHSMVSWVSEEYSIYVIRGTRF